MAVNYRTGDEPIAGFQLQHYLGKGTFGSVWKATAPGGAEVAIKFIDLTDHNGFRELKALQLIKRLRHPNIVPLMGFWLKDELGQILDQDQLADSSAVETLHASSIVPDAAPAELIVVMGLGDQSLFDRLKQVQQDGQPAIEVHELLKYMEDIARAIDFLNGREQRGSDSQERLAIQHCDIKPQNILLVGGAAQLCDLGLVRLSGETRSTRMAFTAAYGAPECFQGTTPSHTTDQYSLAISYVELRTGELPFEDLSSPASVIQQHLASKLDLDRLPELERQVIQRATAQDPAARYNSTLEFVQDLKAAVAGDLPLRRETGMNRKRWLLAGGAAAVAMLAVAAVKVPEASQAIIARTLGRQIKVADQQTTTHANRSVEATDKTNPPTIDSVQPSRAAVDDVDDTAAALNRSATREPAHADFISSSERLDAQVTMPVTRDRSVNGTLTDAQPDAEYSQPKVVPESPSIGDVNEGLKSEVNPSDDTPTEGVPELDGRWVGQRLRRFAHRCDIVARQFRDIGTMLPVEFSVAPIRRWASSAEASFAARALATRDLVRAKEHITLALELDPKTASAQLQAGRLMAQHNQLEKAIDRYTRAIELDSKLPTAFRLRGIAFAIQGQATRAHPDLTEALRQDPNDAIALRIRALVQLELGRYAAAVQDRVRLSTLKGGRRGVVLPLQLVQATTVDTEDGPIELPPNYSLSLVSSTGRELTVDFIYEQQRYTTQIRPDRVRPNAKL